MPLSRWAASRVLRCRLVMLGALAAPVIAGCGHGEAPGAAKNEPAEPELPVISAAVLPVGRGPWPAVVRAQGTLVADEVTVVGAKVAGRVAQVGVDLGDRVAAGAPLAALDQDEFRLQVALAEAQLLQSRAALGLKPIDPVESLDPYSSPPVREARAVVDEIKSRIERVRQLRVRNAVTKDELDAAISEEGVADARYAAAVNGVREKIALIGVRGAELSVAQQRLSDTAILSPFDGVIQQRHVAPGSYVQVGDPIVTLVRTRTLRFRGTIPERHAHRLAIGQQVTLTIESLPEPQTAQITRISPTVDELTRSLMFEAEVANEDGSLRTGLFAEAEVIVDPAAEALVVPASALTEFAGAEKVWKVVDGIAQEQIVETARRTDEYIEIADGLAIGDLILAEGSAGKVARVEFLPADSPAEAHTVARQTVEGDEPVPSVRPAAE